MGGTTPSDFDQDIAAINEYLEEKIHVKLDLKVAGWGDEKKMNTIINSGEYFDMMFVNNTNYSRFVKWARSKIYPTSPVGGAGAL